MGKKRVFAVLLSAVLIVGCSRDTTYRVLSVFFDGVPAPGSPKDSLIDDRGRRKSAPDTARRIRYGEHGPYAAKLCDGCHLRGGSFKLIMPIEELCFHCHTITVDRKKVHGPLASGGCRVCHEPHGSSFRLLLTSESREFCVRCHATEDVLKREVHRDNPMECTDCHDAHASDNEHLLK